MKLPKNLDKVCLDATALYGVDSQEAVAIGEIGELLTLYGRRAQGRDTHQAWVDEIADVIIMAHQLAVIHGLKDVEARIAEKVVKIQTRLVDYAASSIITTP